MKKHPVLLSIPHGGTDTPEELQDHLSITKHDLFDDSDPYVFEIYNLGEKVQKVITAKIARAFVDLNRSLQDLPPKNPDGLVKSMTCYQKQIYITDKEPDIQMTNELIEKYYKPYHRQIQKSLSELELQVCFDCHSMAEIAPNISPDGNSKIRPLFCISNQDGKTSSNEMLEILADSISESYCIDRNDVSLNDPFKGGHITRTYGNNPVPWIQIEMNRSMYLDKKWFNHDSLKMDESRLKELNSSFGKCVDLFFSKID